MVRTVRLSKKKSAEDYQRQIYYLRILKEDDQLIAVSKELLANFPDKKDYLLELSQEFFNQQKFDKSLELMTIFVDQFPTDLSAKSNKGMLLEIVGKKKEALKIYEEILAIDPNQAHTRNLHDKLFQTIN
jgi:tetratricopeptide (TPR) repeat protein